jgi:hypothetical protein
MPLAFIPDENFTRNEPLVAASVGVDKVHTNATQHTVSMCTETDDEEWPTLQMTYATQLTQSVLKVPPPGSPRPDGRPRLRGWKSKKFIVSMIELTD